MAEGLGLETNHGVVISDLQPEGPAATAGVQVDDIVVALNGRRMTSVHELNANIYRLSPGTKVTLRVQRGSEQLDLPIVTAEQSGGELDALADLVDPQKNVVPELGIVGLDITQPVLKLLPELRRPSGVVVAARKATAPYSGPMLQTGDVIYAVNRQVVSNVTDLRQMLDHMKGGQAAVLLVERDAHLIYIAVTLD